MVKGIERILLNGLSKVNYKDNSTHTTVYKEVASWTNITSILRVLCAEHIRLVISIVMVYIVVTLFVGNPFLSAETSTISNAPFSPSFTSGSSHQGAENQQLEASSIGEAVEVVKYPQNSFLSPPPSSFPPHGSEQINQGYQTPLLTLGTNLQTFTTQASEQTPPSTRNILDSQPITDPSTDSSTVTRSSPLDSSGTVELSPSTTASPPTAPPTASLPQPLLEQPSQPLQQSAIQQQSAPSPTQTTPPQTQLSVQTSPTPQNILPPTSGTILPQASVLPPLSTTFPPTVYPPVSSILPFSPSLTGTVGYPSTTLGNAGTGATTTSVGRTSEIISPWFPSLPAMYCGGTFLLTIEGTPRGSDNENAKLEPSDPHNGDDDDKDLNYENSKDRRLLSLQVNSDNTRIFTDDDAIFGKIFTGKKNIDQNKGSDFEIKSIFNDCQIVTYSNL